MFQFFSTKLQRTMYKKIILQCYFAVEIIPLIIWIMNSSKYWYIKNITVYYKLWVISTSRLLEIVKKFLVIASSINKTVELNIYIF